MHTQLDAAHTQAIGQLMPPSTATMAPELETDWSLGFGASENWQAKAVAEYTRTADKVSTQLRQRLLTLTGYVIEERAIAQDVAAQRATAVVDGVVFLLRRRELMVVRPCAYCGTGRFESAPVENQGDLGYMLAAWQPYHRDCEPTDPDDDASW